MNIWRTVVAVVLSVTVSASMGQDKITLGYTGVADFTGAFIAKEEGIFKKHGLDVNLQLIALNSTIPAAMQSGSLQIGGTTPTVLIQAVDSGLDLVGIANVSVNDNTAKNPALVARTGSNIKSAQDIIGKKVGVPGLNATLHVMVRRWLNEKGVDYKKVTFIETPIPQMSDLLKGGAVDVVITADPFIGRIEQAGTGSVLNYLAQDFPSGFSNIVYSSTRDWATKNPAALKAFREALQEGIAFAEGNPEKARVHVGKYIKLPPPVLQSLTIPKMTAFLQPSSLRFWTESMRQQEMLRTDINLSNIVVRWDLPR